jgi:hypothetical protein
MAALRAGPCARSRGRIPRFVAAVTSPKRLSLEVVRREGSEIPRSIDQSFQAGRDAGRVAQALAGDGIRIRIELDADSSSTSTRASSILQAPITAASASRWKR